MSHYLELEGKRALVTGGTKGVGERSSRPFAKRARECSPQRDRDQKMLRTLTIRGADVSTAEGCAVVANAVRDRLGGIDIIVHVVAVPRHGRRFRGAR